MSKRDDQIIELVHKYGELSVQELSDLLGISPSTVRRDLVSVGDHRFIERTHGGVALATVIHYDNLCVNRQSIDAREVRSIALRAAEMIHPGDVVGLSGGEICTYLAFLLRMKEDITIVTNAINIAVELVCLPGIQVRLTGGRLNSGSFELTGKSLEPSLDGIHIQKFFLGTDGLSPDYGVTAHDEAEATASRYYDAYRGQYCVGRQPKIQDHQLCPGSLISRFPNRDHDRARTAEQPGGISKSGHQNDRRPSGITRPAYVTN